MTDALEEVKDQPFVACGTASVASYDPTAGMVVPPKWTVSVVAVEGGDGLASWVACGAVDHPLELVTVRVEHEDGASLDTSVVKRAP